MVSLVVKGKFFKTSKSQNVMKVVIDTAISRLESLKFSSFSVASSKLVVILIDLAPPI